MSNKLNAREELVLSAVLSFVGTNPTWTGTMTALRNRLVKAVGKSASDFPRSPAALRITLNRVVGRIRTRKISVKFGRTHDHAGLKFVQFVAR
jgi:hypothetical protein